MERYKTFINPLLCGSLILLSKCTSTDTNEIFLILAIIVGGMSQTIEGIKDSIRNKRINVELLMIISAIAAAYIGEILEGATLILIFSVSGALEQVTTEKSTRDIHSLMSLDKVRARRMDPDGNFSMISLENIKLGDRVLVQKGETVSVDGKIIKGETDIDESMISGESNWVSKSVGSHVYSGTLNMSGPIVIETTNLHSNSLVQNIINMVENSVQQQSQIGKKIEKIETVYSSLILLTVILTYLILRFVLRWPQDISLYRSIILLVVASPCALIASSVPATLSAISNAARQGILIKGGNHLEMVSEIKAIAFDKTGTLTEGKPQVLDSLFLEDSITIKRIVKGIESQSSHPLAKAIVSYIKEPSLECEFIEDINGVGVSGIFENNLYNIGKNEDNNFSKDFEDFVERYLREGCTIVYVCRNKICIGVFALRDKVRESAILLMKSNHYKNIHKLMLTGDNEDSAMAVASEIQIDAVKYNCLPEEKVKYILDLKRKYQSVMMVGDGINDAPSLAQASLGVSVGSGTDIAIESADIVLMTNNVLKLETLMVLSLKLKKIIQQNISFSIFVIISLIVLNLLGLITLTTGVIAHEGSTILVILNSLRMLNKIKE